MAVLLVGAAGFAVAEAVIAPQASQIPVVVSAATAPLAAATVPAAITTPTPAAATGKAAHTPVVPSAAAPAPAPVTPGVKPTEAGSADSDEREVVMPSVRDDNDGDENGSKPSDHDADDAPSSSGMKKGTTSD